LQQSEYRGVKTKVLSDTVSSYTAPTALDIRQEFEQISANVFYSTF